VRGERFSAFCEADGKMAADLLPTPFAESGGTFCPSVFMGWGLNLQLSRDKLYFKVCLSRIIFGDIDSATPHTRVSKLYCIGIPLYFDKR
jgi:hypothetical protein